MCCNNEQNIQISPWCNEIQGHLKMNKSPCIFKQSKIEKRLFVEKSFPKRQVFLVFWCFFLNKEICSFPSVKSAQLTIFLCESNAFLVTKCGMLLLSDKIIQKCDLFYANVSIQCTLITAIESWNEQKMIQATNHIFELSYNLAFPHMIVMHFVALPLWYTTAGRQWHAYCKDDMVIVWLAVQEEETINTTTGSHHLLSTSTT